MNYHPGQRVALVRTSDPHTRLRPGDHGTVTRHDTALNTVAVNWDTGSRLIVLLNEGDLIRAIDSGRQPDQDGHDGTGDSSTRPGWGAVLEQLRTGAADAGREQADWWQQDTLGGRSGSRAALVARRVLTGITDGDPAVLNGLPTFVHGTESSDAELYHQQITTDAPDFDELTLQERREVIDTYAAAFDDAMTERVTQHCTAAGGAGLDLTRLDVERRRLGRFAVFAGDWAWTVDKDGRDRIPVGYVGVLTRTWNGWAVFACTRQVAEAIVDEHQQHRDTLHAELIAGGRTPAEAAAQLDSELVVLAFDGDTVVADARRLTDDPQALWRTAADSDGRYTVMGGFWTWTVVDPYACDRIIGELPAPGREQLYEILPHTGIRVPHTRIRVAGAYRIAGTAVTAALLAFDGQPVGVERDPDGRLRWPDPVFAQAWDAYRVECRHHDAPIGDAALLDALITEDDHARARAAADAARTTRRQQP